MAAKLLVLQKPNAIFTLYKHTQKNPSQSTPDQVLQLPNHSKSKVTPAFHLTLYFYFPTNSMHMLFQKLVIFLTFPSIRSNIDFYSNKKY